MATMMMPPHHAAPGAGSSAAARASGMAMAVLRGGVRGPAALAEALQECERHLPEGDPTTMTLLLFGVKALLDEGLGGSPVAARTARDYLVRVVRNVGSLTTSLHLALENLATRWREPILALERLNRGIQCLHAGSVDAGVRAFRACHDEHVAMGLPAFAALSRAYLAACFAICVCAEVGKVLGVPRPSQRPSDRLSSMREVARVIEDLKQTRDGRTKLLHALRNLTSTQLLYTAAERMRPAAPQLDAWKDDLLSLLHRMVAQVVDLQELFVYAYCTHQLEALDSGLERVHFDGGTIEW